MLTGFRDGPCRGVCPPDALVEPGEDRKGAGPGDGHSGSIGESEALAEAVDVCVAAHRAYLSYMKWW